MSYRILTNSASGRPFVVSGSGPGGKVRIGTETRTSANLIRAALKTGRSAITKAEWEALDPEEIPMPTPVKPRPASYTDDDPTSPAAVTRARLAEIDAYLNRYMVMSDAQRLACSLWALHSHCHDLWSYTPRLGILSPEAVNGKTTLADLVARLGVDYVDHSSATPAAVFTTAHATPRHIIYIDEVDKLFGLMASGKAGGQVCSILNRGYGKGSRVTRTAGRGKNIEYNIYSLAIMAGLGESIPPDLYTRTVTIRLRRASSDELRDKRRYDLDEVVPLADGLRTRIMGWLEYVRDPLTAISPELPAARTGLVWRPLLAIAQLAGPDILAQAVEACTTLAETHIETTADAFLAVVRSTLGDRDSVWNREIVDGLAVNGINMTQRAVANALAKLGVLSHNLTRGGRGGEQFNGYYARDLVSLWNGGTQDAKHYGNLWSTEPLLPCHLHSIARPFDQREG
jgi:hypothetical protein